MVEIDARTVRRPEARTSTLGRCRPLPLWRTEEVAAQVRTRAAFVDTGAWVALRYRRDGMHARAVATLKRIRQDRTELVTTDYVLAEAVTLLKARGAVDHAIELGAMLRAGGVARLVPVEASHRDRAWALFVRCRDLRVGYVDCTSFAVMQLERLTHAFTFDRDFRAAGFSVLGGI